MKAVVASLLLLASTSVFAHDPRPDDKEQTNKLLGAVAGGYLGSTIGAGDGKTIATVIGAVLGFRYGNKVLDDHYNQEPRRYVSPPYGYYRQADIYNICRVENPYPRESRFFEDYQKGCVQRKSQEIREYQRIVEQQGYKGYNSHEIYEQGYRGNR